MIFENKKTNLLITVILTLSLITVSIFAFEMNSVSAETTDRDAPAIEQVDDLLINDDTNANHDGYIVKIKDGKENKVDEDALDDYKSTKDNEFVVIDEPKDTLDFVDPKYVEFIEPNFERSSFENTSSAKELTPSLKANAAYVGANSSQYAKMNVSTAWDNGFTGAGSVVTVLDSGLNVNHSYLTGRIQSTKNYYNYHSDRYAEPAVTDNGTRGHGTIVTGLVAANGANMKGIAYESKVNAYKIMEFGNDDVARGNVADFLFALDDIMGNPPNVINMSFGGPDYSSAEYQTINKIMGKGVLVIAAVGNDGQKGSPYSYPADYPNVVGVGSIANNEAVSYFSNQNLSVDVVAPGEYLTSLLKTGTTGLTNDDNFGTSFAAPIVAGAAALFAQSGINQYQLLTLIRTTSRDIYARGYDANSGYGIIDIGKMSNVIKSGTPINPSYDIVYYTNGGGITGSFTTLHTYGTPTALPNKTNMKRAGYTFSHWIDGNNTKRSSLSASHNSTIALTAIWSKNYKIKFNGNGGKVKSSSLAVSQNMAIGTLKAPKNRKGYNFVGWFTKKSGGTQYYTGKKYTKSGNQTLYAQWTKKKVVKFNATNGTVKKYAKPINKGKKYGSLPKPTRSGYTFKGWYTKKSGGKKITSKSKVTKAKNITLYARWKKK